MEQKLSMNVTEITVGDVITVKKYDYTVLAIVRHTENSRMNEKSYGILYLQAGTTGRGYVYSLFISNAMTIKLYNQPLPCGKFSTTDIEKLQSRHMMRGFGV